MQQKSRQEKTNVARQAQQEEDAIEEEPEYLDLRL